MQEITSPDVYKRREKEQIKWCEKNPIRKILYADACVHKEGQEKINEERSFKSALYTNIYGGFAQLAEGCRSAGSHGAPVCAMKHITDTSDMKEAAGRSTEELNSTRGKQFLHEETLKLPVEMAEEEPHHGCIGQTRSSGYSTGSTLQLRPQGACRGSQVALLRSKTHGEGHEKHAADETPELPCHDAVSDNAFRCFG